MFSNLEDAVKYIESNQRKIEAYQKQQERMATYQKANPDKCREKAVKYYANMKANEPEKYEQMKQQKRTRYKTLKTIINETPIETQIEIPIEPPEANSLEGANGCHPSHLTETQPQPQPQRKRLTFSY